MAALGESVEMMSEADPAACEAELAPDSLLARYLSRRPAVQIIPGLTLSPLVNTALLPSDSKVRARAVCSRVPHLHALSPMAGLCTALLESRICSGTAVLGDEVAQGSNKRSGRTRLCSRVIPSHHLRARDHLFTRRQCWQRPGCPRPATHLRSPRPPLTPRLWSTRWAAWTPGWWWVVVGGGWVGAGGTHKHACAL
jgi:hypothetical protein